MSPAVADPSLPVSLSSGFSHSSTGSSQKPDRLNFSSLFSIGLLRGNHKLSGHGSACLSVPFIWLIEASCGGTLSHQVLLLHFTDPQHNPIPSGFRISSTNATKNLHCASLHAASFLSCILQSVLTCSFVLSSGRPVQRSLFLVSVPTMMASVMMVMVVMSFLNRFRQSVVIQIHLLRALWCKSGCGASHGGIRNGLRMKTRWWLHKLILEYYKGCCTEIAYNNTALYAKPPFYLRCINTGMNSRLTKSL